MKEAKVIRKLYRTKDIERISLKLGMLGEQKRFDAIHFMNIRVLTSILVFVFVLCTMKLGYIYAPVFTILYYYFFYYSFNFESDSIKTKRRSSH